MRRRVPLRGHRDGPGGDLSRVRRAAAALALAGLLAATSASAASATVKVYDSDTVALLGKVEKAKCKLKRDADGRYFVAHSESTNGDFSLNVNILDWHGFKRDYDFFLGVQDPNFFLTADYGVFSNVYEIPGTPSPIPAGGARFVRDGEILRLGVYLAPSEDLMRGVKFAGGMRCVYPRR